jgi:hypothetical protein
MGASGAGQMAARKTPPIRPAVARNGQELARLLKLSEADSAAIEQRVTLLKRNANKKRLARQSQEESKQMDGTVSDGLREL